MVRVDSVAWVMAKGLRFGHGSGWFERGEVRLWWSGSSGLGLREREREERDSWHRRGCGPPAIAASRRPWWNG